MSWSKALKTLRWCGNDGNESCLAIGAFEGIRSAHCQGKSYTTKTLAAIDGGAHRQQSTKSGRGRNGEDDNDNGQGQQQQRARTMTTTKKTTTKTSAGIDGGAHSQQSTKSGRRRNGKKDDNNGQGRQQQRTRTTTMGRKKTVRTTATRRQWRQGWLVRMVRTTGEDNDVINDDKGGHFWWRRPWWWGCCWLLAVGHWPLVAWCFCWQRSYIKVGIVLIYIPNVFFPV